MRGMLTAVEIDVRVKEWETQGTEFKREFSTDPIRKTLVAFSNDYAEAGGGVLVIGVDPSTRSIVGVDDPEGTMRRVTGLCRDGTIVPTLAPRIYPVEVRGKTVVVVEVRRSERRPHRANNICYIRVGPTTRKATPDEEFELVRRSERFPFDMLPVREASYEDLDLVKFAREFLPKRVAADVLDLNGRSPVEWAEHLKFLIREGERLVPTVAAILLFGKEPQRFFPHSSIDFIRFGGDDPSYPILDRKELTGTLDALIKAGVEVVERYMVRGYRFSERSPVRTDIVEYPLRAVREAIANAVVHRDYERTRTNVSIKMFDDRIEILSPGGLFGIVTRENFGTGINDYRNPTLAVGLNLMGLVERAGTGIFLIRRQFRENGALEPTFEIGDHYLLVKLPAHPDYLGVRLYQKGLTALERGDRNEAASLFRRAAELVPRFPEVWAAVGRLEGLYGNIAEARKAFQEAIVHNPQFERAYLEWGKVEGQAGNVEKAREVFRQGTQALPESAALWHAWGLLEQGQRNWEAAATFFRKSLALQPDEPGLLWFELMRVLIRLDAPVEEVARCFEAAYSRGFRSPELFWRYHRYLSVRGRWTEARRVSRLAERDGVVIAPAGPELYVGRLPTAVPMSKLRGEIESLFCEAGFEVERVFIHKSRRFGFVTLAEGADVERAVATLNGAVLLGKRIVVERKRERKPSVSSRRAEG